MSTRATSIPTLKTVRALRGQSLSIDLGKEYSGVMSSWMKKSPTDNLYRSFEVRDNRYLFLAKVKTQDYYDETSLQIVETISGKWYFDVRLLPTGSTSEDEEVTIFKGVIEFSNQVTDSNGIELVSGAGVALKLTDLLDTPSQYLPSDAGKALVVNSTFDGVEFQEPTSDTYSSTLAPTVASPQDVGGIPAGTTVGDITGDTFSSLFSDLLFPTVSAYISDASNLAISGFNTGSLEVGTNYSFTAAMSYDIGTINNGDGSVAGVVTGDALTFNLANPNAVNYTNNSVVSNSDSTITAIYAMILGSNVWTFSGTNSVGATTYTNNKGVVEVVSSIEAAKADVVPTSKTLSKAGYYPLFYGMSASDTTSVGTGLYLNGDLTKNVASTGNRNISLTGTNEYVYFSYPSSSGALSSIIDGNGFDVTNSFTLYTISVTSSGQDTEWTSEYNVYRTTSVTTIIGQTFNFNF